MGRCARSLKPLGFVLLSAVAAYAAPAAASPETTATTSPSTLVVSWPNALGALERPPVEFDHAAHTAALKQEGCTTCHRVDKVGLHPGLAAVDGITGRNHLLDAYHEACIGCHTTRAAKGAKAGPLVCGGCHVRRAPAVSERAPMHWDYSLHARHTEMFPDKCGTCHHSKDEKLNTLVYVKGTEESCDVCHGDRDQGKNLSLAHASHTMCVGCHLQRTEAGQKTGPTQCVGCHDARVVSAYKKLDPLPRLLRGQEDRSWIGAEGTHTGMVLFDHVGHEPQAGFCSGCHHKSLKPCLDCHTLTGAPKGQEITLEEAYHSTTSQVACVGCHAARTQVKECVGCHRRRTMSPAETSCAICHSGPPRATAGPNVPLPPPAARPVLPPLPHTSDSFPETVTISSLSKRYEPVKLPHAKIVAKLDAGVRTSPLASRFHRTTDQMCAGCHHHSPVGVTPPECRSCHGTMPAADVDRPALMVAYHRQCIGCHQAMGIKQQGCTDCHAAKEVKP
jgi:hypothetical protein